MGAQIRRPDVGNRRPADWTENQKSLKAQLSGKEGKGEIRTMSSGSRRARQWAGVHSRVQGGEGGATEEEGGGDEEAGAWCKSCEQWLD